MKWDEQAARFLRKAAMDARAMSALIAAPQADDEVIGFHAQQAVEKLSESSFEPSSRRLRANP